MLSLSLIALIVSLLTLLTLGWQTLYRAKTRHQCGGCPFRGFVELGRRRI